MYPAFFDNSRSDRVIDALVLVLELVREPFGLGIGVAAFAGLFTHFCRVRDLLENVCFPLCRDVQTVDRHRARQLKSSYQRARGQLHKLWHWCALPPEQACVIDALVLVPELVRELFGLGIGVAAFAGLFIHFVVSETCLKT